MDEARPEWSLATDLSVLRTRDDLRVWLAMRDDPRSSVVLTGLPALAFAAGTLIEAYGFFVVLGPGAILEAILWIAVGLLLQAASGAFGQAGQRGDRLTNPVVLLKKAVQGIRKRVREWDYRE